jgi:phosphoribosylglycinamide formyltransferase-1
MLCFAKQTQKPMKNVVLFASGAGSNAENIIHYFAANPAINIVALFCNNEKAAVISKAERLNVPVVIFSKCDLLNGVVSQKLECFLPDLIVLAGFLLKLPSDLISKFPGKIINIHPALLPKFGGHGMYGMHVHRAVVESKDSQTGITIHYVDEHYDQGDIIFQSTVEVDPTDTCEEVAGKVHLLELKHFPKVIENILSKEH